MGDPKAKSLDDSTLAYTWFANENRVVLLTTRENLGNAFYLLLTTYDGIEFAFSSCSGEVETIGVMAGWSELCFLSVFCF